LFVLERENSENSKLVDVVDDAVLVVVVNIARTCGNAVPLLTWRADDATIALFVAAADADAVDVDEFSIMPTDTSSTLVCARLQTMHQHDN
jgi:hypothetical protein